jgi:hypothetical protein
MQYSSSKRSQVGDFVWMEVGAIDCVAGGRDGGSGDGVLVSSIKSISGGIVKSGSTSDTLEQPAITMNRNNKNIRLM